MDFCGNTTGLICKSLRMTNPWKLCSLLYLSKEFCYISGGINLYITGVTSLASSVDVIRPPIIT